MPALELQARPASPAPVPEPRGQQLEKPDNTAERSKQISAWLWRLAGMTRFPAGHEGARAGQMADYAAGLAHSDLPAEAFSRKALYAVASAHTWFPAFRELKEGIAAHWNVTKFALENPPLPDLGPAMANVSSGDRVLIDKFRQDEAKGWLRDGETSIGDSVRKKRRDFWLDLMSNHHPTAYAIMQRVLGVTR